MFCVVDDRVLIEGTLLQFLQITTLLPEPFMILHQFLIELVGSLTPCLILFMSMPCLLQLICLELDASLCLDGSHKLPHSVGCLQGNGGSDKS